MTTKNDNLFIKEHSFINDNCRIADNENQYSNLNLNQNRQCTNVSAIHSNSKSYNKKFFGNKKKLLKSQTNLAKLFSRLQHDFTVSENYEENKKSQSLNKFSKTSNFPTLNTKVKESANEWKKNGTSNATKNSILSLHISAYENSVKPENNLKNIQKEELKKKKLFITDTLFFNGSPTFIQNQFEFSRQQENEESKKPEVGQFKASQTLLNPNKTMDYFDKNGKPCKACFSVEDMMKMSKKFSEKKATSSTSSTEVNEKTIQNVVEERRVKQCPVDKDELGRSTWNLLHTMAAYYPEKPSTEEKKTMETTLISLSKTYPCSYCADDFRKDLKVHPPKLENRDELSKWMCEMHNRVNKKLGKDMFDCTKVKERWLDGWKDGSCDP